MKKGLALFVCVLVYQSCISQKIKKDDLGVAIESVFRQQLNDSALVFLVDSFMPSSESITFNEKFLNTYKEFSKTKIEYLASQQTNNLSPFLVIRVVDINLMLLEEVDEIYEADGWTGLLEFYPTGYYFISKPIFSKRKKYFLIKIDYKCGPLCGSIKTVIYKRKRKEHYIEHKIINMARR